MRFLFFKKQNKMLTTLTATETKTETRVKILAKLRLALVISVAIGIGIVGILLFAGVNVTEPIIECAFDKYGNIENNNRPRREIPCGDVVDLGNTKKNYNSNVELVDNGHFDKGLLMGSKGPGVTSALAYDTRDFFNNQNKDQGALEFWLKPTENDPATQQPYGGQIFYVGNSSGSEPLEHNFLYLWYRADGRVTFQMQQRDNVSVIIFPKNLFKDKWHHFAINWRKNADGKNDDVNLYVDGEFFVAPFLVSGEKISFPNLTIFNNNTNYPFRFGDTSGKQPVIPSIIDEFKVYQYFKENFITENPGYPSEFFTYIRPIFGGNGVFNFILPTTKPKAEEITDSTSIFASRGEYEPVSFAIYSHNSDLNDISITAEDLRDNQGNIIGKNNLDIRVVKVWQQDGMGMVESWSRPIDRQKSLYRANYVLIPELLVYDDNEDYNVDPNSKLESRGRFIPACQNNLENNNLNSCTHSYYDPPSISQVFNTSIPKYQSKQIWITVYVPKDAKTGNYSTKIHIKPQRLVPEKIFNLNLKVLDIDLAKPKQDYGIWYKQTLGPQKIQNGPKLITMVSYDLFNKEVQDIVKHGFETVSTDDFPSASDRKASIESIQFPDNYLASSLVKLLTKINPDYPLSSSTNFREEAFKIFRQNNVANNVFQLCKVVIDKGISRGTRCAGVGPEIDLAKKYSYEPIFDVAEEPSINSGSDRYPIIDYGALLGVAEYTYNIHLQDSAKAIGIGGYDTSIRYDNAAILNMLDDPNNGYIYNTNNYYDQYKYPNPYSDKSADHCADPNSTDCYEYHHSSEYINFATYKLGHENYPLAQKVGSQLKPQSLDIRVYGHADNYFNSILADSAAKDKNKKEYIYWQLMHQLQKYNRFRAGYNLWNIKMDGIFPYAYQHIGSDPYDDFDYFIIAGEKYYRDQMATYPSKQGPIPTIEWENLREGIDDVKYLTTLEQKLSKLDKINKTKADLIRTEVADSLKKYNLTTAWEKLSDSDFQNTRSFIANKIIDVDLLLKPEVPVSPVRPAPILDPENPVFFSSPKISYSGANQVTLKWQAQNNLELGQLSFRFGLKNSLNKGSKPKFDSKKNKYYVVLKRLKGGQKSDKNNKTYQKGRALYSYQVIYKDNRTNLNIFKTLNRFQTILFYYKTCQDKKIKLKKYKKPNSRVLQGEPYKLYQLKSSLNKIKKQICR